MSAPARPVEGPYTVSASPSAAHGSVSIHGKGQKHVAEVWNGGSGDPAVALATANLLASSHDLRDALQVALPYLHDLLAIEKAGLSSGFKAGVVKAHFRQIEAALKKAGE